MMSSVILDAAPTFAFLALPPPPNKKRVVLPSPLRTRSHSIIGWAESVHPGSPAPLTPALGTPIHRRSSPRNATFRRPSLSSRVHPGTRRQSVGSARSPIPSASFLDFFDTPDTNSHPSLSSPFSVDGKEPKFDLTVFGYTSVFALNLPNTTPATPEMKKPSPASPVEVRPLPSSAYPSEPAAKTSRGVFKCLQSIALRSKASPSQQKTQAKRGKSRPSPVISDYMAVSSKKRAMYTAPPSRTAAYTIEKKKRVEYMAALPDTVLQEAQFRQVMEGGSLEFNVKMVMEEKAQMEGIAKVQIVDGTKIVEGVDDVWRDAQGGFWRDQDEEWEFAHLLGGKSPVGATAATDQWIPFGDQEKDDDGSLLSSRRSSRDSDLHESYAMQIDDSMDDLRVISRTRSASITSVPSPARKVSIVLAIPSRPSRMAKHLRKPAFLLDPFPAPIPVHSPSSPATRSMAGGTSGGRERSRSLVKQKRAPPPLQLVPPSPRLKLVVNQDGEEESKREFLANSFEPTPAVNLSIPSMSGTVKGGSLNVPPPTMKKKTSMLRMGGLFKKGEKN